MLARLGAWSFRNPRKIIAIWVGVVVVVFDSVFAIGDAFNAAFDSTNDAVGSVADGLASTAQVITAAAAIMMVIFGSFVLEDDRIIKVFGLGLAMAILLDATVVRLLLVPAAMELLGERNWWLPGWLQRTLPRISIEGSTLHEHVKVVEPNLE